MEIRSNFNQQELIISISDINVDFHYKLDSDRDYRRVCKIYTALESVCKVNSTFWCSLGYSLRTGGEIVLQLFNDSQNIGYSIFGNKELKKNLNLLSTDTFNNKSYLNLLNPIIDYIEYHENFIKEEKEYD